MTFPMIALLQAGYYAEPHAARYDAATMGMFVLIIAIGVIGFIVQARLQSVFKKYSKVQFPGGLTGAEVAEKLALRLKFDAENGKGSYLKARSSEICEMLVKRFGLDLSKKKKRASVKKSDDAEDEE